MKRTWVHEVPSIVLQTKPCHTRTHIRQGNEVNTTLYTQATFGLCQEHPLQTSPNSQLAMADVSWRSLLAPLLDVGAAATVVLVLQLAPVPLAGPVLQCLAKAWRGQELPGQSADNIVWKCAQYLPGITRGQRSVAPLPGSLTSVQKHCQQLPAVRIASAGSTCLCCGAETRGKKPLSGASICNNCTTLATNIQGLFSCGRAAVGRLDRATMSCVPPVRAGALVIQAAPSRFWAT